MRVTDTMMCGAILACVSGTAMAQQTLFEQLPGLIDIFAQDATGSQPGARHADNFSLTEPVEVTSVQWWGSYVPLNLTNPTALDNFTVTFYADGTNPNSGVSTPGDVIFQQSVSVTAVDTGADIAGVVDQYLYTATFSTPIVFEANQTYWFAPLNDTNLGDLPDTLASWGWEPTLPQAGATHAFLNLGLPELGWRIQDDDSVNLSFRLNGNIIPSPSVAAVFGAAGLMAVRRRR